MDHNRFRAEIITAHVVHSDIVIEVWIRLAIWYSVISTICACAVDVDGGLLTGIQSFFLLESSCENLIIAFEEFTSKRKSVQLHSHSIQTQ